VDADSNNEEAMRDPLPSVSDENVQKQFREAVKDHSEHDKIVGIKNGELVKRAPTDAADTT
jgi:hypothetical protein